MTARILGPPTLDAYAAIESIVRPKSVVVVGANERVGKLTSGSVSNLLRHGYPGRILVVNPHRETVFGVPCFPSLADLPELPDTAVIVVSAERVAAVIEECAAIGIRTATVVASGFGEGGQAGHMGAGQRALRALKTSLAATGIRVLGPNTAGLLNIADHYVPRASENHPYDLPSGPIGVVTQSGGLCNTLVNRAGINGVGIGLAVATGNQVDLDLWDVARFMLAQPDLRAVVTIIEGFSDPQKFLAFAREARDAGKPVIALKLGTSAAGQRAVETHSGSMAGSATVQQAVLADLNVIQVTELDELWEVASLVASWGPPHGRVNRLGVITPSGGDGAIAADEASKAGLAVAPPSASTTQVFARRYPGVQVENPFDTQAALVVSPPESLPEQVRLVADDDVHVVLLALPVLATPFALSALGPLLEGLESSGRERIAASIWTAGGSTQEAIAALRQRGWPVFGSSVRAVRAIGHYDRHAARADRPSASWRGGPAAAGRLLTYWASRQYFEDVGVPFNRAYITYDVDDAVSRAKQLGYPVTLKLSTEAFTHKADVGAVVPFLRDEDSMRVAAERLLGMLTAPGGEEGLCVEEYVAGVLPVFVGAHRDPEFGPVLVIGLGGAYAETYEDVARVSCPSSPARIAQALGETRVARLLAQRPSARESLLECAASLSELIGNQPGIVSFDLNPIFVRSDSGLAAVDARVALATT